MDFDKNDLKFLGPCPVCRARFIPENIAVLKKSNQTSLLHVDCSGCESSISVTLIKNGVGIVTNVGVLTDLKKDDFGRFGGMPPITVEDVIQFQKLNKKNDSRNKK